MEGLAVDLRWWGMHMEPTVTDPAHPLVATLAARSEEVLGWSSLVVGAGGCDMRLTNRAGIPSVLYGASGGNGHGIDEFVEIESLLKTVTVVALAAADYCDIEERP
jgi:acetylornithine deacetylase